MKGFIAGVIITSIIWTVVVLQVKFKIVQKAIGLIKKIIDYIKGLKK
jgi:hypothetical protein